MIARLACKFITLKREGKKQKDRDGKQNKEEDSLTFRLCRAETSRKYIETPVLGERKKAISRVYLVACIYTTVTSAL